MVSFLNYRLKSKQGLGKILEDYQKGETLAPRPPHPSLGFLPVQILAPPLGETIVATRKPSGALPSRGPPLQSIPNQGAAVPGSPVLPVRLLHRHRHPGGIPGLAAAFPSGFQNAPLPFLGLPSPRHTLHSAQPP
ncbi:hypothetical protein Droror1_Dr00017423 [Drosera rotundifolia]